MGLFDDFNQFLETRLDEFLRNHPHLELQALEEQLREQEKGTLQLIADLQRQEKKLQEEILSLAKDIQTWHARISKAKAAGRPDLAQAAEEREAALLRQGNQRWGQMEGVKERIAQAKELFKRNQRKRQEVQAAAAKARTEHSQASSSYGSSETSGWSQGYSGSRTSTSFDPLEDKFRRWEVDEELEKMKRNL